MLVSLPFRRFIERLARFLPRRRVMVRLRPRWSDFSICGPAVVETLEARVLLSTIVVNSTSGGTDYAANVTYNQLDPAANPVTLRDAINAVNNTKGAFTISFDQNVFLPNSLTTITLPAAATLDITDNTGLVTIAGPGAGQVAVSGGGLNTVFKIETGVNVTISGLTITGGNATVSAAGTFEGGGIYNAGALTLQNDIVTANSSANNGGGLYNFSTGNVTITGSTFSNNSAQFGGGFFNVGNVTITDSTLAGDSASSSGGGFYNQGTVNVTASTLSGDSATANGGGFYNINIVNLTSSTLAQNSAQSGGGFFNLSRVTVLASTIAANTAQSGGGVYNNFGNVTLQNSIVARNTISATNLTASDWFQFAANSASSYNLIGDGTNSGLTNGVNSNIVGTTASPVDPHLAALASNGGPTQTMELLAFSPAINAGSNTLVSALSTDQRGAGFSRIAGGTVDIGAFEIQSHPPAPPTVAPLLANVSKPVLTGVWDEKNAILLQVTVNGTTYTLGNGNALTTDGAGNWTLSTTVAIPDGSYSVTVHTVNDIGEVADATVNNALVIDTVPPAIPSINSLITNNNHPVLTGTWDSTTPGGAVILQVTLNGTTYTLGTDPQLTSDNAGDWTLTTTATIPDGKYDVSVHTADAAGNVTDATRIGALIVDTVPPATPTVNLLITNNSQPVLTGSWDSITPGGAVVLQVTLNGTTYTLGTDPQLTNDGAGHWALTTSAALPDGTYSVTAHTADAAGNVSDATVSGVLVVDTVPPATPTVNSLLTDTSTPVLTGTWDSTTPGGAVVLQVTVNGTIYTLGTSPQLISDNAGNWTLALSAAISDGAYSVTVHTADAAANISDATVGGALVVDTVPPATPTVNSLITNNNQPVLTGTWDATTPGGAVVLQVSVNGTTYTLGASPQLTSDNAGHWTLAVSAAIPDETYSVTVHTADAAGNISDATATGALIVDTVPPATPTVNSLVTNNNQPVLTGTWDSTTPGGAVVLQVTVNGTIYTLGTSQQLTSDNAGHWTLAISTAISDGAYSVTVHTADAAGNISDASVAGALIVDTVSPATPTVNSLATNSSQPILTGTWDSTTPGGAVVLQVTVNGTTYTLGSSPQLTSDGAGHWTLTTSATIPDGTYSVTVHTADAAGNVADATVSGALIIDTVVSATPTVNPLTTTNTTPTLTGTWDAANSVVLQVTISNSAASYSATYTLGSSSQLSVNGGSWTLNLAGTTPLALGTYSVSVHTANKIGISADSAGGSLVINANPPVLGSLAPQSANVGASVTISAAVTGGDTTGLTGTIQWGDGTKTSATIAMVGGVLTVSGSHAYSAAGKFTIQMTVTNAAGLSATASTTATITAVSSAADLKVTAGPNVQITAPNTTTSHNFDVKFVSGGVQLSGVNGTTFNGQTTVFIANVKSLSIQLTGGDDQVRITGSGGAVTLAMGGGQNSATFQNFTGGKVQVSSDGALSISALSSTLSSLTVSGGSAADSFQANKLRVTGNTQLALGGGANTVQIDDSRFNNFNLQSSGSGTTVQIEAGAADGTNTQFDGSVVMQLGGGAQITTSPNSKSDKTIFNGNVNIVAGSPNATWVRQNVTLARTPTLKNVTVVSGSTSTQHGNANGNANGTGNGNGSGNHNGTGKD